MARPVFMVCCSSRSEDRNTNFLSIFEILEGYKLATLKVRDGKLIDAEVTKLATEGQFQTGVHFCVISLWMQTEDDSKDDEFLHELAITDPGEPEKIATSGVFRFEKSFQRLIVELHKGGQWKQSGICEVESRIKKKNSPEWIRQRFPIPIQVVQPEVEDADEGAAPAN